MSAYPVSSSWLPDFPACLGGPIMAPRWRHVDVHIRDEGGAFRANEGLRRHNHDGHIGTWRDRSGFPVAEAEIAQYAIQRDPNVQNGKLRRAPYASSI